MFNDELSLKQQTPFIFALVGFLALQALFLMNWAKKDLRPPAWDEAIHARVAHEYADRFETSGLDDIFKPAYFNYPPLYHYFLAPALTIWPDAADAGPAVNFLFLCGLLFLVYLLGTDLAGPWSGLTAAFLVGSFPMIQQLTRLTLIDLSLTFWVTAAFYALFKSEEFNHLSWSLMFGALLGLGMLAKWTALAYLVGPLAFVGWAAFKAGHGKNILFAAVVFLIVTLPWYLTNFFPMMARIFHVSSLVPATGDVSNFFGRTLWYGFAFVEQMNLIFFLFLIPGLVVGIWRPRYWPLILWLLVPVVLFTLIHNRNIRYTAPVLPAAALLAVGWLPDFRRRVFLVAQVLIVGLFFIYQGQTRSWAHFNIPSIPSTLFHAFPASDASWKHDEIINAVLQLAGRERPFTRVVTVSNAPWLHSTTLNVSLRTRNQEDVSFRGPSRRRWFEFSEFILYKTGEFGHVHSSGRVEEIGRFLEKPAPWFSKVFREVGRWDLPDGTQAILYQCLPRAQGDFKPEFLNLELDELEVGRIKAKNVKLKFIPVEGNEGLSYGKGERLEMSAGELLYKKIRFENVGMVLIKPQINLPLFLEKQEIEFLNLAEIRPKGTIQKSELLSYLKEKADWLEQPEIDLGDSQLTVSGKAFGIGLKLGAFVKVEEDQIRTRLEKLKLMGLPFPLILVQAVTDRVIPLEPNREMPFRLGIEAVEFTEDGIAIIPKGDE